MTTPWLAPALRGLRTVTTVVGGAANVERHFHCMTRLRIVLVDADRADLSALKALPAVLGVVAGNPLQIVIGPGAVAQASAAFADALAAPPAVPAAPLAQPETAVASPVAATRAARKNTAPSRFLRRIASIFTPLIPALIGAGLLNALAGLLRVWAAQAHAGSTGALPFAATVASIVGSAFFAFLVIQVGINAAAEFRGTACLGCRGIRSPGRTAHGGSATKSRSPGTACSWT